MPDRQRKVLGAVMVMLGLSHIVMGIVLLVRGY